MIAEVVVDASNSAIDKIFEYNVPNGMKVELGQRVIVPFGARKMQGFVLGIKNHPCTTHTLKDVLAIKENGQLLPEFLDLVNFLTQKYNLKKIDALRLCVLSEVRHDARAKTALVCKLQTNFDVQGYIGNLQAKQQKQKLLLQALQNNSILRADAEKQFGISALKTLEKNGAITILPMQQMRKVQNLVLPKQKQIVLNPDQKNAIEEICQFLRQNYVLFGVTGSGKTEVYMNVIERALARGKTALLLVPEISLTPQVFGHLSARFGTKVAVLHSGLSAGERFDEWQRIERQEAVVVVGARSAIFAPLQNLGVIIVDEEHEHSYNSETHPRYRAQDVAAFRANWHKCPLVLGSATPSVETFAKTLDGTNKLLRLPHRVHNGAMPQIEIVDMGKEVRQGNDSIFSLPLVNALNAAFKAKKSALLFLNRRGFSSFLQCSNCGYIPKCTDCDIALVYHKADNLLKCHFCGKRFKVLTQCPNCKSFQLRQGHIGTQKVVDELHNLFPDVPIFRLDNDAVRTKNGHQKILQQFAAQSPAVLCGTQMIAKGHDFDNIEVVGVLDADQTLYQSDFLSTERTFELLTQVSGRAGRKSGGGKVFLQTFNPKHYVYSFAQNYDFLGFFEHELNVRQTTNFPPFSVILRILIAHEKEDVAYGKTKQIFDELKPLKAAMPNNIIFLGAMASPHARLKNKFRFQVLLRFTNQEKDIIIKQIYQAVNKFQDGKVQIFVEINPSSLA